MSSSQVQSIIQRQRQYFASGKTRSIDFRVAQLHKLKDGIKALEREILEALRLDLGKSGFEAYGTEVGLIYEEINHALAHIHGWTRPRPVPTPLVHQPSLSKIHPQPKGVVLLISPWNYPFQLLIGPLIGAIAAGNCAVLKPSEVAPKTSAVLGLLISRSFSPEFCAVIHGGIAETTQLLKEQFDHIFFTGSIPVGRIVMRAAAEHLTPVTLELGGKSPCFVDQDIDLNVTARRIVWGKFTNAGQTCVAPDYLLVQRGVKNDLVTMMKKQIAELYGTDPMGSPDYGRIINEHHFDRLLRLKGGSIVCGGQSDRSRLYIAPTLIDHVKMDDNIMEDEIFGPLLPILTFDTLDEGLALAKQRPNPLACYAFSKRAAFSDRIIDELPFGGGCVNNVLVHLGVPGLPFGGIGSSGIGAYHGEQGFQSFSHLKSILKSPFMFDLPLRYPPYKKRLRLMRQLMR